LALLRRLGVAWLCYAATAAAAAVLSQAEKIILFNFFLFLKFYPPTPSFVAKAKTRLDKPTLHLCSIYLLPLR